ncbi:MAG: OmpA family protein, partial [Rhodospirillaceae bacterium]
RARFLAAAARLERGGRAARDPGAGAAAPRPTPATIEGRERTDAPLATRFVVYFGLDDADLSQAAEQEIALAADAARRTGAALVRITGHADRAGTEPHNLALSRARAVSVANALRRLGLPPVGVATLARGETEPLVATGDGVPEARNRRAEIDLAH